MGAGGLAGDAPEDTVELGKGLEAGGERGFADAHVGVEQLLLHRLDPQPRRRYATDGQPAYVRP